MFQPDLMEILQQAYLGILRLNERLEDGMELGDGRKRVRERLGSQVQERLDEDLDPERMVRGIAGSVDGQGVGQVFEDLQGLFWSAFLLDGCQQVVSCCGPWKTA